MEGYASNNQEEYPPGGTPTSNYDSTNPLSAYSTNTNTTSPQHQDSVTSPTTKVAIKPHTTSSTASHQHQQEQELLSGYTVPNPPVSTQQSTAIASEQDPGSSGELDKPRTLWMGDLDPWLDENAIQDLWWSILQKKVTIKIIKPKNPKTDPTFHGLTNSGYCFVEFESFEDAQQALSLNGQLLPDIAMPSQQHFPNNPDNQKKYFRLNWASGATLSAPIVQTPEFSLFVGDLSASTTEAHLLAFFQKTFPNSIKTVRVMTDPISGKSRCFGFVRFTEELERQRALVEMNGVWFAGRPLRVALATPRITGRRYQQQQQQLQQPQISLSHHQQQQQQQQQSAPPFFGHHPSSMGGNDYFNPDPNSAPQPQLDPRRAGPPEMMYMAPPLPGAVGPNGGSPMYGYYGQGGQDFEGLNMDMTGSPNPIFQIRQQQQQQHQQQQQQQQFADPNNTTVFVGGLSSEVNEPTLYTLFKPFGMIQQVKIPPGKNCGFVKYSTRDEAEEAIAAMQGFIIGGNRVRLSWGRVSMNNKKYQQQQHQVAQAAQLQVAAALSMGMDPATAIAAAAAAAAGGYPPNMAAPPPPPGAPPHSAQGHHQLGPGIPGGVPHPAGMPPQGGAGGSGGSMNMPPPVPMPGMGLPMMTQYQGLPHHSHHYSSDDGSGSADTSGNGYDNNYNNDGFNRNMASGALLSEFGGMQGSGEQYTGDLTNAMAHMSLESGEGGSMGYGYMIPPAYGGYGIADMSQYQQLVPEENEQEGEDEDEEDEEDEREEGEEQEQEVNNDEGQNKEENTENYVTEKVEDKSGKDKEKTYLDEEEK
ncbi:MAG: hypothetical protein M5F18_01795 [Asgard group archaeon]|nr:hypothetical protein [Asgard group archaeon]